MKNDENQDPPPQINPETTIEFEYIASEDIKPLSDPEAKIQAPLDVEFEKGRSELEQGKQSEEAWEQVLAAFKEKTLKLQRMSQEAYGSYLKTTMVVLKKAAKDLNIEAAKASYDISIIVQELEEEGRHYIALAAANSPEPLKDAVETFTSSESIKHVSEIRDFYVGVPYGAILSLGGFLDFMITGSTAAIRFGMILGGIFVGSECFKSKIM